MLNDRERIRIGAAPNKLMKNAKLEGQKERPMDPGRGKSFDSESSIPATKTHKAYEAVGQFLKPRLAYLPYLGTPLV